MPCPAPQFFTAPNLSGNGNHKLAYYDWGNADSPRTAICVHGLTRNARDFDFLAEYLVTQGYRVLAISMAGRGQSEWLANPLEYNYASYVADCLAFMNMFHLRNVDWIGTSMGGIIGMMLAANTQDRIRKLVLNDVGSMLNQQALQRIYGYVQTIPQAFANRADAENYLRRNFAPWGIKTDEHWRFFIDNSLMQNPQGQWQLLCDPAIAEPLRLASDDFTKINAVDLGEIWAKIQIPTLILRGENSDILTAATVSQMQATNPRVQSETIAGCGHAPALAEFAQLALIGNCLAGSSASLLAAGM